MDSHTELIVDTMFSVPGLCSFEEEEQRSQAIKLAPYEPQTQSSLSQMVQDAYTWATNPALTTNLI